MDDIKRDSLVSVEEAKNLFKNDYANVFGGIDLALQNLVAKKIDMEGFKNLCALFTKDGKIVLKFSEKYNLPIPKVYETEIAEIDGFVDKINVWVSGFLKDTGSQNIEDLRIIVSRVNEIIKIARKK